MKLALYHGYELSGSGSNEYTRYLARTLAELGHEVVLICVEPEPEAHDFVTRAWSYDLAGEPTELFSRDSPDGAVQAPVTLHQLPRTSVYPVFITDKQRPGHVKTFPELTREELEEYHAAMVAVVKRALADEQPAALHANHLIYQPIVAAEACAATGVPFYIVPHGSSIEYTINRDERFRAAALVGLRASGGVAWIAREVRQRVLDLYPEDREQIEAKSHMIGVGTDTSLFAPLARAERQAAIDRLAAMHRPGGKTPAQRRELQQALGAGDVEATRRYWDAYDHKLEDDDLPQLLHHLPVEDELIFFVGAMTYGKGIQSLIAAMPAVLQKRPRARLVLVGSGSYREVLEGLVHALATGDEPLADALIARGRDLERASMEGPLEDLQAYAASDAGRAIWRAYGPGLADRVHFIGRLDHPRLRCIFPCCQLAVFPSVIKEASPLVFMEALANGVLPCGSYHSGLRDGLDDLRPHLSDDVWQRMKLPVDPAGRVERIADNICWLLEYLAAADIAPQLRQLAVDHYDWKPKARALVDLAARISGSDSR